MWSDILWFWFAFSWWLIYVEYIYIYLYISTPYIYIYIYTHTPIGHLHVFFGEMSVEVICPFLNQVISLFLFLFFVFLVLFCFFCYWVVWVSYVFWKLTPYQIHSLQIFSTIPLVAILLYCFLCRNIGANLSHDSNQCNLLYVGALSTHVWSSNYHYSLWVPLEN